MDDGEQPEGFPRQDQLMEEASLWFARMRGPDAEQHRPAFDKWLAFGASHRGAYNRAGEIFALGKFLAETPDQKTIDERNRVDSLVSARGIALSAGLLFLAAAAWLGRDYILRPAATYEMIAAEPAKVAPDFERVTAPSSVRQLVTLADGSKIALEPGSLLYTRFSAERRELRLGSGRVRFTVAHEARPFIVYAGGGSVTARGTIFDVLLDRTHGVTVYLLQGAVDVARPSKGAGSVPSSDNVTRLTPGETLSFGTVTAPGLASDLAKSSTAMALQGERPGEVLDFEKTPLATVIAQANQGAQTKIRLGDKAIGHLQVSGRFRIDDPEQVAERLAALLNLKVEHVGDHEILLDTRGPSQ